MILSFERLVEILMRRHPAPILFAITLALGACAAPADRSNMTVSQVQKAPGPTDASLIDGVAVGSVDGGQETQALGTSEVDNEDFQSALMDSLRNYGLLAEGSAPRHILYAHLLDVHQPLVGLNMTVTAKVQYELVDAVNRQPAQERTVETEFTSPFGAAFAADERTRLANEGAIRENIAEFLDWLSRKPPAGVGAPMALR
jgi:hypothetical protein